LKSCDIGWNHSTTKYEKKNPYEKTAEIIKIALHDKDKEAASKRLENTWEKNGSRDITTLGGGMPIRNLAIMVFGVLIQRHWPRYWTG